MTKNTSELAIVSRLLNAMAISNSPDEFCDLLANDVLKNYEVAATYVAVLASDGKITMIGSWGYPPERRSPEDRPSLWHPMAITDTIRTGEIQVYSSWQKYVDKYPHLIERAAPGKSFVCVPFTTDGRRVGGLGLTFLNELGDAPIELGLWQILAQAGNVLVSRSWAEPAYRDSARSVSAPRNATGNARDQKPTFSTRELDVIERTIAGETAKEIAFELRYSESTIKQERMAIYKKLGVSKATDVRAAAHAIGIIPPVG